VAVGGGGDGGRVGGERDDDLARIKQKLGKQKAEMGRET